LRFESLKDLSLSGFYFLHTFSELVALGCEGDVGSELDLALSEGRLQSAKDNGLLKRLEGRDLNRHYIAPIALDLRSDVEISSRFPVIRSPPSLDAYLR
jgi:hypothetical protein